MSFSHSGKPKSVIIKEILGDNLQLLHAAYRYPLWLIRKIFQDTIILETKHGRLEFSLRDEVIGRCLYMFREYEYAFSSRCLEFLKDERFLIKQPIYLYDIGANIGFISIGLLRAGLIDRATAIEPEPQNFNFLKNNILHNECEGKISVSNCALSDKEGTALFMLSNSNSGGHYIVPDKKTVDASTIEVKSLPLDIFVQEYGKPSVVWIDIEGHEGYVFRGGQKLLSEGIPVISEISPYVIERAGMKLDEFTSIVKNFWSRYWINREQKFVSYPIATIESYYDEIGFSAGQYGNIILTT